MPTLFGLMVYTFVSPEGAIWDVNEDKDSLPRPPPPQPERECQQRLCFPSLCVRCAWCVLIRYDCKGKSSSTLRAASNYVWARLSKGRPAILLSLRPAPSKSAHLRAPDAQDEKKTECHPVHGGQPHSTQPLPLPFTPY